MKTKLLSVLTVALQLQALACGGYYHLPRGLVAHEWGTFTSVQGADGVQMRWNPRIAEELPSFVHNAVKPDSVTSANYGILLTKADTSALQRMETPVIYFYSKKEQTVSARVDFPEGAITEWFPQAHDFKAKPMAKTPKDNRASFLEWRDVKVLPPGVAKAALPAGKPGSHYYAAREVEANALSAPPRDGQGPVEQEKFLFYRGVGNFQAPLTVTASAGAEQITLRNTGQEELRHLYTLTIDHGQAKFVYLPSLAPGATERFEFNPGAGLEPLASVQDQISRALGASLSAEGLYPREASAMVRTWHDSWFTEQGVRVLYTLPRSWTDRTLPLTVSPQPDSIQRVMVGRAELITPDTEWRLLQQIARFASGDAGIRSAAVEGVRQLGLGRFAEAALRRVLGANPGRQFSDAGWGLLNEAAKPSAPGKPLVSR